VAVVDDCDDEQRQAHLSSAEYHGIHSRYFIAADHKFAAAKTRLQCKKCIEYLECDMDSSITPTVLERVPSWRFESFV
jgi:hypothetical protein